MADILIEVNKVKTLDSSEEVSFQAVAGDIICLFGMNGSGKTLLLKTICGIFKPFSGSVISNISDDKRGVCLQFPEHLVFNETTMGEAKLLTDGDEDKAKSLIKEVGVTEEQSPFFMSDGQKRLLFLYGFLETKDLLLFDEPFASLDSVTRDKVASKMAEAGVKGKVIIYTANRAAHGAYANKIIKIVRNQLKGQA